MRIPIFVPVPVVADPNKFPIVTLLREKRDFGITAAIVTAIVASAAAAVTAGIAMANQVQTVLTINEVVQRTSSALTVQVTINKHLASGILLLNKRVDLLENNLYTLFNVISMSCVDKTPAVCVTPYLAKANESKALGQLLAGNWSRQLESLQRNLILSILDLNQTRAEMITLEGYTDWLLQTISYFKEWVGVGMFGVLLAAGVVLALFLLCRISRRRQVEKMAIAKALAALDAGSSPQAWIAVLKDA